jgi:hypothetical protein
MSQNFLSMPLADVVVDAGAVEGPLELWRHSVGLTAVNHLPLPDRVVAGLHRLEPRLIRVFIQEFFHVYPEHGRFDWTLLDPYMAALERTGAKVVAAIAIKPPPLFPTVDQAIWQPNDVDEWRRVIAALVSRYSVDRRIVTYWEIGNEPDAGEAGGCPYLMPDPAAYIQYYQMTSEAVLDAFPGAKVGGPATCWVDNEPLPGLVAYCRESGTQLDFISWHRYSDNPRVHALGIEKAKALLAGYPGTRPELLVTEWNKSFEFVPDISANDASAAMTGRTVSVEDMAFAPRRAAIAAASILAMAKAGPDWTFYFAGWDMAFYPEEWRSFFSAAGSANMQQHWNEVPHRFGLFGVSGEVRPQYFVYQLLSRLGPEQISATCGNPDLHLLAARGEQHVAVVLANLNPSTSHECLAALTFRHLTPGPKVLTVYRIDEQRRWTQDPPALRPVEQRPLYAPETLRYQVYAPADSVILVSLQEEGTGA